MRKLKLVSKNNQVRATILPEYGGLLAKLSVEGVETLRFQSNMLGVANVLSGGAPVLFPFPSHQNDDEAVFDGRHYAMPMHGFVKDMPFDVVDESACRVVLAVENSKACRNHCYPFDFRLTLVYTIDDTGIETVATIENRSDTKMPCALGYHPYFWATDATQCTFVCNMRDCHNYINGAVAETHDEIDIARDWDHVFAGKAGVSATLVNRCEGYEAVVEGDDTYTVLTLCTTQPEAICIEPWQAQPNAANTLASRWIAPHDCETSCYRIDVRKL